MALLRTDSAAGLEWAEAAARLERLGPNVLPRDSGPSALRRLLQQFQHPLIYLLLAAAAVSIAIGQAVDAAVILGVVLFNAIVGYVQESRAADALAALASMVRVRATVVRGGRAVRIASDELVPGDVALLAAGDAVPADVRLLEVEGLRVDESALTGESLPVSKHVRQLPTATGVADRANVAHAGTLVVDGTARGVVVATGVATEIGLVHALMRGAPDLATPLTRKIAAFSRLLMWAILALAAATYLLGLARGNDPGDLVVAVVALAVGAIPEGLPAAVTIVLAVGVSRMARRRAVVRRLPAVETLGSTTVICSDKTGTLTANEMTVQRIVAGAGEYAVGGSGYAPGGQLRAVAGASGATGEATAAAEALHECLVAGALCNDAELRKGRDGFAIVGDPTEAALLVAAAKGGVDVAALRRTHPRVAAVPFRSELRFMATLHRDPEGGAVVYVKGAVERVVELCGTATTGHGRQPLDHAAVLADAHRLAGEGLRVLALARVPVAAERARIDADDLGGEPELLGLQAMMDPPRPAAIDAVAACHQAGIDVKMITGDHAGTAMAIARRMGIDRDGGAPLTGTEIAALGDDELADRTQQTAVFARVSPEQKLRLVGALQERGHIVAMTGDGVNDAPALEAADIGVAMGRGGTDVARDAADIVLTDDDFSSIEAAVEEGRRAFDNLTKFIVWTLPTNVAEGLLVLVAIAAGVALPILPVQILWINMTTAGALGVMLAFERAEPGIMRRPPRDPAQPLMTGALLGRMLLVSLLLLAGSYGLFEWAVASGYSDDAARTVAVNVFIVGELFYLLNCRSLSRSLLAVGVLSNCPLLAGMATIVALQALFTYTPFMNSAFGSAPIGPDAWWRIAACGVVVWLVVGAEKAVRGAGRDGASI